MSKQKFLVSIEQPEGVSVRQAAASIRAAIQTGEHFPEANDARMAMVLAMAKATVVPHVDAGAPEEAIEAVTQLREEIATLSKLRFGVVTVMSRLVRAINGLLHVPPTTCRTQQREFWKDGARETLAGINKAINDTAKELILEDSPEPDDAELFRVWIDEASNRPVVVAKALAHCHTTDDYRTALRAIHADRVNLFKYGKPINEQGSPV